MIALWTHWGFVCSLTVVIIIMLLVNLLNWQAYAHHKDMVWFDGNILHTGKPFFLKNDCRIQTLKANFSHIYFYNSFKICTEDLIRRHNWKHKLFKSAVFRQAMIRQIKPRQNNSSTTTAVAGMQCSLWLERILKQHSIQRFTTVIKLCFACRWKWPQCLLQYTSIRVTKLNKLHWPLGSMLRVLYKSKAEQVFGENDA